jgi:ankyrin repeat protein
MDTMKRYLSLAIGAVAILGTLFFLLSGLLAILVTFAGSAGLFPWSALLVVGAGTAFGLLTGSGAVLYFFYPEKIKFYYTFPAWITVSLLIFGLFIVPMLDDMKLERQVRAFLEQNDRGVAFGLSNVSLNEAIKLLEKYPQGEKRLRALEVIGKVTRHNHRADEILRKEVFNSLDSEARHVALEAFWESNQGFLRFFLEFDVCNLLDDKDPELRDLASKLLIKELPGHSRNLSPADLCRNYRAQEPLRSRSKKEGADTLNRLGDTPLILATRDGNLENVKALIARGADVNLSDWYGRTPLFHALSERIVDMTMIEFLVSSGADVNLYPINGNTLLQESIRKKGMPEFLINHGADVTVTPGSKIVPLNEAIYSKNNELIKLLLEKEVDVNSNDKKGQTLLHIISASPGSSSFQKELIEELISRGAKVNPITNQGDTPYKLAATRGRRNIAGLLRSKGGIWNSPKDFELVEAVRNMDLDKVKALVFEGADVNVRDIETEFLKGKGQDYITMPLKIAVEAGDYDIAKFLIDKGADINVILIFRGKTLLCTAISRRKKELVELLLAGGADPNKKCRTIKTGNSLFTPLRVANLLGYGDIAGLLAANGAIETQRTTPTGTNVEVRAINSRKTTGSDLE